MDNNLIIIQARMGSTRLQGKVLKKIMGDTILTHVVNRVRKSKYAHNIVVATTENIEDDIIYEHCKNNGVLVFRGSENDVLDRYYQCSKKYKGNNIIRITSDCPLHDASVIDRVIEAYLDGNYDYVSNTFEYTYPDGLDVEVFSFKVLEEAWENAKLSSEREHVTPYIRKNNKYKKVNVVSDRKYPICRLTLDSAEDYELIKRIYEGIGKAEFSLDETIEFLMKYPELFSLNNNYKINEGYEKSLKEDSIIK